MDVMLTAYYRAYQVGKRHPRPLKIFLIATTVTTLVVTCLVWYRPVPALFVFVIPMISSLFFTAWVTYAHHAGLDVDNDFEASYNIMTPIYNTLTGNLGYHTAHHHKQGLHWSLLPELHEKIKDKIPEYLYKTEHLGSGFLKT
jgi:fatty acid desaturase